MYVHSNVNSVLPIHCLRRVSFHSTLTPEEIQTTLGGSGSKPCRSHVNVTVLPSSYDVEICSPSAGRPGSMQTGPKTNSNNIVILYFSHDVL